MIIIDASVASKWILQGEKDEEKALKILSDHTDTKEQILVPEFIFYEIANTLATKTILTENKINNSLSVIFKANLLICHPVDKDIIQSTLLAKRYKTSVYDMLYAVVAKRHKTILITADNNFLRKTKFPFVKLISEYK